MGILDLTYYDTYQVLLTVFIIFSGLITCLVLTSKTYNDVKLIICLYFWHTLFSIYFWYFSLTNTADAVGYYKSSFQLLYNLKPGTEFTTTLTAVIIRLLDSNYLNTTLVFNIFGSMGLIYLYLSIKHLLRKFSHYWIFTLFIPSMSFWSAGVGKDSISFLSACLFVYAISQSNKRLPISFAFLTMFMVRPHIAFMMLVSFIIYFIIRSRTHLLLKFLTLPIILAASLIALQFVQQYVGLGDANLESLNEYVEKRQGYNQEGGASLDISSMSYPMQMFTYIFRPLPFEAHSAVALITSIENTILLLLIFYIVAKSKFNFASFIRDENLWLFVYALLTCSILAVTTANLGIATRQKWMFMPVLIYLLIYAFHDYRTKKAKVYS